MGSLMLLFIGFGYAKPVPVNTFNLNNPRKDIIKVAAAGPISNLILAFFGYFSTPLLLSSVIYGTFATPALALLVKNSTYATQYIALHL